MRTFSLRQLATVFVLLLTCSISAAALVPASASAMLMGVEANGELLNPERTPAQQAASLDRLQAQGARLARLNVSWKQIAGACGGQSPAALRNDLNPCYDWRSIDSLVSLASERDIELLFSVSRAPFWLHRSSNPMFIGATSAAWGRTVQHYPAFITAIATRYDSLSTIGTVKLWTIWNEPNSKTFWAPLDTRAQQALAPTRYAILYGASAKALKAANPSATVAPGPTGPNSTIKPVPYIKAFQKVIARYLPGTTLYAKRRYLGAWAHNPYPVIYAPTGNPRYGYNSYKSPDALGFSDTRELIRLLDSVPITRGLKVWATEFGWETNPPEKTAFGIPTYLQARYIAEGYDLLDATGRVTIGVSYVLTDPVDPVDFQSGTFFASGKPKPSFYSYQRMISTSSMRVRRGQSISIYAKANTDPSRTAILYSTNGYTGWRTLPSPRRVDGSIRRTLRMTRTTYFATWDGTARGPKRGVLVRG
jgi:hypothetical protein